MTMNRDLTTAIAEVDIPDVVVDQDRAAAERALEAAQRNPILSGEQACAIAQVHALLAIEPWNFGDRRFVLKVSGDIEMWPTKQIEAKLAEGKHP